MPGQRLLQLSSSEFGTTPAPEHRAERPVESVPFAHPGESENQTFVRYLVLAPHRLMRRYQDYRRLWA